MIDTGCALHILVQYLVQKTNKIEGTPILKLAMVKRKKNVEKIKIRRKYSNSWKIFKFVENIKIPGKDSSKRFVEKIRRKEFFKKFVGKNSSKKFVGKN